VGSGALLSSWPKRPMRSCGARPHPRTRWRSSSPLGLIGSSSPQPKTWGNALRSSSLRPSSTRWATASPSRRSTLFNPSAASSSTASPPAIGPRWTSGPCIESPSNCLPTAGRSNPRSAIAGPWRRSWPQWRGGTSGSWSTRSSHWSRRPRPTAGSGSGGSAGSCSWRPERSLRPHFDRRITPWGDSMYHVPPCAPGGEFHVDGGALGVSRVAR
jgi:hypothetical protein